jgi:UDP-glucose 4-epimerase
VDLCNAAAVELLFQRRHFDAVVHFAGLKVSRSCAARRGTTSGPTHVGSS